MLLLIAQKTKQPRRWGFVIGILSEPFWIATAYKNEQWGIFAMCFLYAALGVLGYRNNREKEVSQ